MSRSPRPSPHPEPPEDLVNRSLPTVKLDEPWFRIHQSRHDPLYFSNSGCSRFDAPAQEYGILYIAQQAQGAFIETFGMNTGIQLVSHNELSLRSISCLKSMRSLRLVDLTGAGLAKIGADNRLSTGDHRLAQRWAVALWQHPMEVDGIYYRARHDPSQSCAGIFDRARDCWHTLQTLRCASPEFQGTLATILDHYEFGLTE